MQALFDWSSLIKLQFLWYNMIDLAWLNYGLQVTDHISGRYTIMTDPALK